MIRIAAGIACMLIASALSAPARAQQPATVLVFCAVSTTDAIEEIRRAYRRLHPEVELRTSYAASSRLARQIESGARADIFLSASQAWEIYLVEHGDVARQRDLLSNQLVIIVPKGSNRAVNGPQDLASDAVRRVALADTSSVPAGIYARQALEKLGLWSKVRGKATGAAGVRQALRFVETGAADAGIVYSTDAAASQQVDVAGRIDASLSEAIVYPLLLLEHGAKNPAAVAFYDFLGSPDASAVFRRHGFLVVRPPSPKPPE